MRISPVNNLLTSPQPSPKLGEGAVVRAERVTTAGEVTFSVIANKGTYNFDFVVIATGGHSSFEIIKNLGHNIIPPKPALTGLKTKEDF